MLGRQDAERETKMQMDYRKTGISLALIAAVVGLGYWQAYEPKPLPDDFYGKADSLAKAGKNDELMALCNEAIAQDPNHFNGRLWRGMQYRNAGRLQEAIADFDIAIKVDPKNANVIHAYYFRGRSYYKLHRFKEALPDFTTVIAIHPRDMWAHYYRGLSHEELKDYASALDDYYVVVEQNPAEPEIRLRMAALEIELGRYDAADTSLKMAKANAGTNTTITGRAKVLDEKRRKLMTAAAN